MQCARIPAYYWENIIKKAKYSSREKIWFSEKKLFHIINILNTFISNHF